MSWSPRSATATWRRTPDATPRSPRGHGRRRSRKGEVAAFRVATEPQSLADLAFTDPEGKPVTLAGLGKASLVNIWATWCVPCRAEMPTLDRLQAAMGGDGFAVVAGQYRPQRQRAGEGLPRRDRRRQPAVLLGPLGQALPGPEAPRPRHRPADNHPRRRQGLPHRGAGGTGGVGLRRRQGADQGGGGGVGGQIGRLPQPATGAVSTALPPEADPPSAAQPEPQRLAQDQRQKLLPRSPTMISLDASLSLGCAEKARVDAHGRDVFRSFPI